MDTAYVGLFGAEDQTFFLPMSRVIAAEREADASIFQIFFDIGEHLGTAIGETVLAGPSPTRLKQCQAVIRNALIGGGMDEVEAKGMVETYAYPARPAIADLALTWSILKAAIYGVSVKKKADGAEPETSDTVRA